MCSHVNSGTIVIHPSMVLPKLAATATTQHNNRCHSNHVFVKTQTTTIACSTNEINKVYSSINASGGEKYAIGQTVLFFI